MRFLTKCPICRKDRLMVRRRQYYSQPIKAVLRSKDEMCWKCSRTLHKAAKQGII